MRAQTVRLGILECCGQWCFGLARRLTLREVFDTCSCSSKGSRSDCGGRSGAGEAHPVGACSSLTTVVRRQGAQRRARKRSRKFVTLPLAATPKGPRRRRNPGPLCTDTRRRILVVDDNEGRSADARRPLAPPTGTPWRPSRRGPGCLARGGASCGPDVAFIGSPTCLELDYVLAKTLCKIAPRRGA